MNKLSFAAAFLLTTACAHQQVSVTTPTSPSPSGQVSATGTPLTSINTVNPVATRLPASDTSARPQWLQARIAAVLAERKRNPITRILRYQYGGKTVYYQSAPCCDQFSQVFDTRGTLLCNPDGGITGKGDGKCPDFEKNKSNEKLVWQDPR